MSRFFNFKIELDPFAMLAMLAGVGLAISIYFLFSHWRMEDGLRARRSPSQVRMEAASVGIVLGAAFPCLTMAWGFGWFALFLFIAIVVALWGRSSLLGWGLVVLGLVAALMAALLGPHSSKPVPVMPVTPPVQTEPAKT